MAFNLWKVVGGSKLLLLPFTGLAVGGTALCYGTYRLSRGWTGSALDVDFDEAGTLCQVVASIGGMGAAGGFLAVRHSHHRPVPFRQILERMEQELHHETHSVTKVVASEGTVVNSTLQAHNPRPPPSARASGWVHDMQSRTRLFLRAARVPVRFYFINIMGAAILAGSCTSFAQRLVCGRTGHESEVGNLKKAFRSSSTSSNAATKRPPAPIIPVPQATSEAETVVKANATEEQK